MNKQISFSLSPKRTKFQKIKILFIFFLGSIFFISCEKHVQEDSDLLMQEASCDPDISYSLNVKPIVDANCLECHAGSQPPNLSTYESFSANAENVKAQVVSRLMPQGGTLTDEEIEFISCWVDNGALDN